MDAQIVSEKITKASSLIVSLIDRYKNGDTASLKKQDVNLIFDSISSVVDDNVGKNKDQVKQFLFSYLRLINKAICTNTDQFKNHIELENQFSYIRTFISDEINNVERNALGVTKV